MSECKSWRSGGPANGAPEIREAKRQLINPGSESTDCLLASLIILNLKLYHLGSSGVVSEPEFLAVVSWMKCPAITFGAAKL